MFGADDGGGRHGEQLDPKVVICCRSSSASPEESHSSRMARCKMKFFVCLFVFLFL